VMTHEDILTRTPPSSDLRIHYGTHPQNFIDCRFPKGPGPFPVLLVIHGGFWRSEYDLTHMGHLCAAFTSKGLITCNMEYRRIGDSGGGWPGTFHDAAAATGYIFDNMASDPRFDLGKTGVVGFSAGGHLALWLSSRHKVHEDSLLRSRRKGVLRGAISLAGVADLRAGWKLRLGGTVVKTFMGGTPEEVPERYDAGSPIELLPSGARQILVHGVDDEIVPVSQSEGFVERAEKLGDHPSLLKLENTGHFDLVDPESSAWPTVSRATFKLINSVWEGAL
jgi:acetyl esterase/lipase